MDAIERERVIGELKAGRDALGDAIAGVDDELARRKPSGKAWSILGCVEHVVETERYLLSRLETAVLADQPFEKWRREVKIAARARDRSLRIEAPEQAHPHGRFRTVEEAMAAFDETRARVVRWVECSSDPRRLMTDHLLIEGPVTCAETLVMIAAHPARHAKQVEEIKQQLQFQGSSRT
jgi:uncharacterized damage-inducible protein DinB